MSEEVPVIRMGCVQPEELRYGAVPAWDDANPVLPESEWEEHDDYAQFPVEVGYQQNNNCTNASLAKLVELLEKAAGVPNVEPLSPTFAYALCNGGRDQGAMCRDVASVYRTKGLPRASLVPEGEIYQPRGGFSPEVLADAAKHLGLEIYQCLNWQHVGSALTRRFLVYHGFVLGTSYNHTGKDGRVPEWDGSLANGHAMHSRGLTRRFGDWRTVTPNTWSRGWGDNGVGYWPKSYFWDQRPYRGSVFVNLDCFAVRAVKRSDPLPAAA